LVLNLKLLKSEKSLFNLSWANGGWRILLAIGIPFFLVASIVLLVFGSYWISFEFQFLGAAALALEYLLQPTYQSYSLITLGLSLPDASPSPNDFGIRLVQVTFFVYALAMPLCHLLFLLFLWLVPLSRKSQRRIYYVTEIFNAWSANDVFVISVIATLLEIEQFAQFIIGDRCDTINIYLAKYMSEALNGVDKCFDVVTKLDVGCWLLFSACVIYTFSSLVVMRACHKAIDTREKEERTVISLKDESTNLQTIENPKEEEPVPEILTPSIQ